MQTQTESTLPWRRKSVIDTGTGRSSGSPIKQQEFPAWIENKDYIPNYASPSSTMLRNSSGSSDRPSVYEIFTIAENQEDGRGDLELDVDNSRQQETQHYTKQDGTLPPNHSNARINMGFLDDENLTVYRL